MTPARVLAGLPVLLALAGCVDRRMSTIDIYGELTAPRIACSTATSEAMDRVVAARFNARFQALTPWLEAEIGRDALAEFDRQTREASATTDFTFDCPSADTQAHLRTRHLMLLHELENRARAAFALHPRPSPIPR